MLRKSVTYNFQNYAGTLGSGLECAQGTNMLIVTIQEDIICNTLFIPVIADKPMSV